MRGEAGTEVTVTVVRDGEEKTFNPETDSVKEFSKLSTYVLASLEKTLIKWAKSIGREYDHVKTLHTSSGVYYGDFESKGSFWDVEVEFKKRGNTEIVLAFAKSSEDIPALFSNEGVFKIVSVQKSKIKYHIDF